MEFRSQILQHSELQNRFPELFRQEFLMPHMQVHQFGPGMQATLITVDKGPQTKWDLSVDLEQHASFSIPWIVGWALQT